MICDISILHNFAFDTKRATALADKRILNPRLHTAIQWLPAGGSRSWLIAAEPFRDALPPYGRNRFFR